jgi:hypothetical protein
MVGCETSLSGVLGGSDSDNKGIICGVHGVKDLS